ncbi:hypothetical protein BCR43DRAFT_500687 [Syncephalastrum racemosum]|uniref:WD40-repeat-containing domain protein n=1 Tax=Syncephalastrum racemosum TaxID=13706 RepID=A0A1X2HT65_SYNRA|nr:hypothetical protein BCR43DRAFT_500687 [Syncephalastrum racemosum]
MNLTDRDLTLAYTNGAFAMYAVQCAPFRVNRLITPFRTREPLSSFDAYPDPVELDAVPCKRFVGTDLSGRIFSIITPYTRGPFGGNPTTVHDPRTDTVYRNDVRQRYREPVNVWCSRLNSASVLLVGTDQSIVLMSSGLDFVRRQRIKKAALCIAADPNPNHWWVGTRNGYVQRWDTRHHQTSMLHASDVAIQRIETFGSNEMLTADVAGIMKVWDRRCWRRPLFRLSHPVSYPTSLDIVPELGLIAAADQDQRVRVWSINHSHMTSSPETPFWISESRLEDINGLCFIRDSDAYAPGLIVVAKSSEHGTKRPAFHYFDHSSIYQAS